jgi:hypothetical protein
MFQPFWTRTVVTDGWNGSLAGLLISVVTSLVPVSLFPAFKYVATPLNHIHSIDNHKARGSQELRSTVL